MQKLRRAVEENRQGATPVAGQKKSEDGKLAFGVFIGVDRGAAQALALAEPIGLARQAD
jgi:hypothetical protein